MWAAPHQRQRKLPSSSRGQKAGLRLSFFWDSCGFHERLIVAAGEVAEPAKPEIQGGGVIDLTDFARA